AAGVAGAVDVSMNSNTINAFIGDNAVVRARKAVDVRALSQKDIQSLTVSVAAGAVGIGGSISIINFGAALDEASRKALSSQSDGATTGGLVDDQSNKSGVVTDNLGGYSQQSGSSSTVGTVGSSTAANGAITLSDPGTQTTGNSGLISTSTSSNRTAASSSVGTNTAGNSFSNTNDPDSGVNAFVGIGASITAENASVIAKEKISIRSVAGGGALAGLGAFGVSVSVVTIGSQSQAYIANSAILNLTGNLVVQSSMTNTVYSEAYAGVGGLVAIGAQVAVVTDSSNQLAFLGNNVEVRSASSVKVESLAHRDIETKTAGGQVGLVAAGASISRVTADGRTEATIGNDVKIDQDGGATVGDVTLNADHYTREKGFAIGVAAGIVAGVGQEATLELNPTVKATVGTNVRAKVAGTLSAKANATPELDAEARGYAAGLAAVGVSLPSTSFTPTVIADVGAGGIIVAGGLSMEATTSVPDGGTSARSLAVAALGGLVGITASS
ncbi:MAG: hypothetical protein EBS30_17715, partial [Planctomycetes bacterium]|nr:hypothetical protein [Planctomycetota bacterium]